MSFALAHGAALPPADLHARGVSSQTLLSLLTPFIVLVHVATAGTRCWSLCPEALGRLQMADLG